MRDEPIEGRLAYEPQDVRAGRLSPAFNVRDLASHLRSWRPTRYGAAVLAIAAAVTFVAALTYYGAQTFTKRAANERASNEAQSFSAHSAKLANIDAFDGYIAILRYADDPVLNDKNTSTERRLAIMQQDLYLNVNKFASLTIATRSGDVLASTDPSIRSVRGDQAFTETRANLSPANSDIVIPTPGQRGYIEYSTPLREPDGSVWGVLVARADPDRLWGATLAATIDGGRNVIVNNLGLFAAGVPDELLGQPWHGVDLGNGGVRANIAGVDSICGLALIGKNTQIDKGLNVASCMPVSLIQAEHSRAMGKQGLVTVAGAILAAVLACGALWLLTRRGVARDRAAADVATVAPEGVAPTPAPTPAEQQAEPALAAVPTPPEAADMPEPSGASAEPPAAPAPLPAAPLPAADVDALTLIDAYEERNARISDLLRETVQAKLLVATTQMDEAFRLAGTDADIAARLHTRAIEELERVRNLELRAIGQELHPALIRLGLPAALKALRKELAETIAVTLDVDATADSLVATPGRALVPAGERLVLYRFALDAIRMLANGGATRCGAALHRRDGMLELTVSGSTSEREAEHVDRAALAASTLAVEAHGGFVSLERRGANVEITADLPAPPVVPVPEGWVATFENDDDEEEDEQDDAPQTRPAIDDDAEDDAFDDGIAAPGIGPGGHLRIVKLPPEAAPARPTAGGPVGSVPVELIHLAPALESVAGAPPGGMALTLDLDLVDGGDTLVPGLRATVLGLVEAIVAALTAAGAARCALSVRHASESILLSAISETDGTPFDAAPLKPYEAEVESFGGYVAVSRRDNAVSVTAEITAVTIDGAAPGGAGQPFAGLLDGESAGGDGRAEQTDTEAS